MEKDLLVSIALCTFNGAEFLSQQLDTIINQTYRNIEIIVVDDCSTDKTFTILKTYAKKYPQFQLYQNEHNLGFIENFERALTLCNGELIALCDQDDLWHPQKIELQVNGIEDNIFIYHDSEFINETGKSMNKKMSDLMNFYRGGQPLAFLFFNCVSGHTILMKRALLNEALPLQKDFFHDLWLSYVATNIGKIDYIPQCLVKYRQHNNSETNILTFPREIEELRQTYRQKFEKTLMWLRCCLSFKANKDKALIENFCDAYQSRLTGVVSLELIWLFLNYWRSIFFVRKKTTLSKLNYVRKQVFGLKICSLYRSNF
jgi:glycosyltransferase involved in cell wall biosynthesis